MLATNVTAVEQKFTGTSVKQREQIFYFVYFKFYDESQGMESQESSQEFVCLFNIIYF